VLMDQPRNLLAKFVLFGLILLAACQANVDPTPQSSGGTLGESGPKVIVVESFLADIAQNVAGERFNVEVLIPPGSDPHTFQPTPQDVTRIANSQLLIANGAGLEDWLQEILDNAGGERLVIEAADSLLSESTRPGDPHFWLDPNYVIHYAEQIRDGYILIDPAGEKDYTQNAADYVLQLEELDSWIAGQVAQIPSERRMLVTNHESFGFFADRYGFKIIGTVIPNVSTGTSPSAQQLVGLIETIKATNTTAIFLESGTNPELAEQVAREAGVKVIKDLLTHSVDPPGGYIEMMKYNTLAIVEALK
jgi:ABC-type Zn uptake system ZnuABC Zn-binding protein ZnuA